MSKSKTTATPAASVWGLEGHVASAACRGVRLDLAHPSAGLVTTTGDHLLGLDLGLDPGQERPPVDRWVRGDDITATWEPGDERELRATGLWRQLHLPAIDGPRVAGGGTGVVAWELIASATTRLLRADSTLAVTSDLDVGSVLMAAWERGVPLPFLPGIDPHKGLVLVRRSRAPSVLLMLHPSDHQAVSVERCGERTRIGCWLFPTGVEKGVLLRSRVLAAIGPAEGDMTWAADLATWFAASPPELAT